MKGNSAYFMLAIFVSTIFIIACQKSPTEQNYYITYAGNPLTNPDSLLKVIFTNPADGARGPFGDVDPTLSQQAPKITVQFNKLININDLNAKNISLKSGEETIHLYLTDDYIYGNAYPPYLRDILIFNVPERYKANQVYTLTIDTTLQDIHGYRLNNNYTVSFIPEPDFRVYRISPASDDVEPLQYSNRLSRFYIEFNSGVDSGILDCLTIAPGLKGDWRIDDSYTVDNSIVSFFPADTLSFETEYTISVSGNAKDVNGLPIKRPTQVSFTTSPFTVAQSSSSSSGSKLYYVGFTFNGPVDTSTIRSAITVSPELPYGLSFTIQSNGQCREMRMSFDNAIFAGHTTYSIQLDNTIHSLSGDYLKEPYIYKYTTN